VEGARQSGLVRRFRHASLPRSAGTRREDLRESFFCSSRNERQTKGIVALKTKEEDEVEPSI
jgi:hypothetical protein